MKHLLSLILTLFFFLSAFLFVLPKASAQNWLWAQAGAGHDAEGWAVASDTAGNVFGACATIGGTPTPSISFGSISVPLPPDIQIAWVKYGPSGNVLWAGGTDSGSLWLANICTDRAGNLYVLGNMFSATMQVGGFVITNSSSPFAMCFLIKISPGGTVLWAQTVPFSYGGNLAADSSGNIYIANQFGGSTFTAGPFTLSNANTSGSTQDITVLKYSPSGALVWASSIGGTGEEEALGITISSKGYLYVAGYSNSPAFTVGSSNISNPAGSYNALIAKFSLSGTPLWADLSVDPSIGITSANALAGDTSGNVYMVGSYYGTSISFDGITLTRPYPNVFKSAIFLVQYSPSNVANWARTISSPTLDAISTSVAVSSTYCGKVWLSGTYNEEVIIAPGDTIAIDTTHYDPLFIQAYDHNGTPLSHITLGSGGDDYANISCDAKGNLLLCSDYAIVPPVFPVFVIGPDTLLKTVSTPNTEAMFVAKYSDSVYAHTDTTVCVGANGCKLTAPPGYAAYYWNNGATGTSRTIDSDGQYYVFCLSCSRELVDTFNVTTLPIDTTRKDTALCAPHGNAILNARAGYSSFLWSTGDTGASITANTDGGYWVYAVSQQCTAAFDSFTVKISNIAFSLGNDTAACVPVTLYAPPFGDTRSWQDNSTGSSYTADSTGIYYLSINSRGCPYSDTVQLNITIVPPFLHDTILCREQPVQLTLQAMVPPGWNVVWNDSSRQNSLYVADTGIYWVRVSDSICSINDTAVVSSAYCDCLPFIPSAFTPNGDGKNDFFRCIIPPGCIISNFSFSIYNRWGEQVFLSTDPNAKWNGMYKGVPAEMGAYEYELTFSGGSKNIKHFLKGDVTLVR